MIIGLAGKSGSGKTTFAGFLMTALNNAGFSIVLESYGYGIKKMLREEFGWNGEKTDFWIKMMTTHGEYKRRIEQDYWVKQAHDRICGYSQGLIKPNFIIIPDIRNQCDADYIRKNGKLIVMQGRKYDLKEENLENITEQLNFTKDENDIIIENTGNLNDLKDKAYNFSNSLWGD